MEKQKLNKQQLTAQELKNEIKHYKNEIKKLDKNNLYHLRIINLKKESIKRFQRKIKEMEK